MASFTPRQGQYIRKRNGRAYYRRRIPKHLRAFYANRCEWIARLLGQTAFELEMEALAIAHRHNSEIREIERMSAEERLELLHAIQENGKVPEDYPNEFVNLNPNPKLFLEGELVQNVPWIVRSSRSKVRSSLQEGFFAMTPEEYHQRKVLKKCLLDQKRELTDVEREVLELRRFKAQKELEKLEAEKVSVRISEALKRWHKRKNQSHITKRHHMQYINEFIATHGDLFVDDITKLKINGFLEKLEQRTKKNGEPLEATTIAKRLETLKSLLSFCVSIDLLDNNPASGITPPTDKRPKTLRNRASFTKEEISHLRNTATRVWEKRDFFKGNRRGQNLNFALDLLIWTGARPTEVCQLRQTDLDAMRGVILITSETQELSEGLQPRSLKNENSLREIPIHSRLLNALEVHLDSLSGSNSPLLFPSFITTSPKRRYSYLLCREWSDYLRKATGITDPRKVLYSLRHSWAAESRRAGMQEHVRNAIMGHANENRIADKYGGDADWLGIKRQQLELMECM